MVHTNIIWKIPLWLIKIRSLNIICVLLFKHFSRLIMSRKKLVYVVLNFLSRYRRHALPRQIVAVSPSIVAIHSNPRHVSRTGMVNKRFLLPERFGFVEELRPRPEGKLFRRTVYRVNRVDNPSPWFYQFQSGSTTAVTYPENVQRLKQKKSYEYSLRIYYQFVL